MNFRKVAYTGLVASAAGLAALLYSSDRDAKEPPIVVSDYRCTEGNVMDIYAEVTNHGEGQLILKAITEEPVYEPVLFILDKKEYGVPHADYRIEALNDGSGLLDFVDFPADFYAPDLKARDTVRARAAMPYRPDARYVMLIQPDPLMDKVIATIDLNDYCPALE